MNCILLGYKTAGKTTLAHAYSTTYGCDYVDTDRLVMAAVQDKFPDLTQPAQLYRRIGQAAFRQLELEVLQKLQGIQDTIIATGGGTVLHPANLACLRQLGRLIYLQVDKQLLLARLRALPTPLAVLPRPTSISALITYLHSRDSLYERAADEILPLASQSVAETVQLLHQIRCRYGE